MVFSDHLLDYQENIDLGHFGYPEYSWGHVQPLESVSPEDLEFTERVSDSEGAGFQDFESNSVTFSELGVQAETLLIHFLGDLYCSGKQTV